MLCLAAGWRSFRVGGATTRSRARPRPAPPPTAWPRAAATIGLPSFGNAICSRMVRSARCRTASGLSGVSVENSEVSAPAQNARPAPVTMTARTLSSLSAASNAASRAVVRSVFSAFSLSGGFRVKTRTAPRSSQSNTSGMRRLRRRLRKADPGAGHPAVELPSEGFLAEPCRVDELVHGEPGVDPHRLEHCREVLRTHIAGVATTVFHLRRMAADAAERRVEMPHPGVEGGHAIGEAPAARVVELLHRPHLPRFGGDALEHRPDRPPRGEAAGLTSRHQSPPHPAKI